LKILPSGILFDNDTFVITTNDQGYPVDDAGNFSLENPSQWHWTLKSFIDRFNAQAAASGVGMTVSENIDGHIEFIPVVGKAFAFSDSMAEDSGLMAALGINTFFYRG